MCIWNVVVVLVLSLLWNEAVVCGFGPLPFDRAMRTTRLFAGGGGFGSTAKQTKSKKGKAKAKGKRLVLEPPPDPAPAPAPTPASPQEPVLDRFGLPVRTAENIFPPLPPGTVRVPLASSSTTTTKEELMAALSDADCLPLSDLSTFDNETLQCSVTNMKLRLLHKDPPVVCIDNFFTPEECDECIRHVSASSDDDDVTYMVDSATFSSLSTSIRTSTTWFCRYSDMATLMAKVSHVLGGSGSGGVGDDLDLLVRAEEPQVVRYKPGQQFSWHYDEIPSDGLANGGQRVATLLVYLDTLDEGRGGGTVFRDLVKPGGKYHEDQPGAAVYVNVDDRLTMRPRKGSALLFFPARHTDGTPDDRTLHAGEAVTATNGGNRLHTDSVKRIAQLWFHQRKYTPHVPKGNSHDAARDAIRQKQLELGLVKNIDGGKSNTSDLNVALCEKEETQNTGI